MQLSDETDDAKAHHAVQESRNGERSIEEREIEPLSGFDRRFGEGRKVEQGEVVDRGDEDDSCCIDVGEDGMKKRNIVGSVPCRLSGTRLSGDLPKRNDVLEMTKPLRKPILAVPSERFGGDDRRKDERRRDGR